MARGFMPGRILCRLPPVGEREGQAGLSLRSKRGTWPAKRGTGVLLAGVVTAIALGACSPSSGNHTIGAKLAPDGRGIQVVFVPCPGQKVISVELVATNDAVIGDDKDPVLWRIEAPGGVAAEKFVVGQTPSGFTSPVPLRAEPPAGQPLGILLDTSLGQTAVGFTVRQLRPDAVFTDGQSLSPEAFRQQAGGQCGGTSS